jgi:hypothetical protein
MPGRNAGSAAFAEEKHVSGGKACFPREGSAQAEGDPPPALRPRESPPVRRRAVDGENSLYDDRRGHSTAVPLFRH